MMQRVVRNNTRKSSLFKIQAERDRFQDHISEFGLCKLFQMFPQCEKQKDFLKEITQTFINYSFQITKKSPFFKAMNYSGKEMGFSQMSNCVHYQQWLPGIKEAYLVGTFSENKYRLQESQDGLFQIDIHQVGQIKIMQKAKVQLIIVDKDGNQQKIAPPSSRIIGYDSILNQYYGICKQIQVHNHEALESNNLIAYEIDIHQMPLSSIKQTIPSIKQSKFNTVILKNLFDFKDKSIKPSMLNKFSLKLSYEEVELLQELIERLKSENIFVLLQLSFQSCCFDTRNPVEEGYFSSDKLFAFDLENQQVSSFLLSFVSYYLKELNIDGYKVANIQNILLKKNKAEEYTRDQILENFIQNCTKGGLLFVKMLTMILQRSATQKIAYATSKLKIPGLNLALDEGGFGFSFSSRTEADFGAHEFLSKIKDNYFNVEVVNQFTKNVEVAATSFISKRGVVHQDMQIFKQSNFRMIQSLKQINYFRSQSDYFGEQASFGSYSDGIFTFSRSRFMFLCNFEDCARQYSISTDSGRVIYGNNNESIISKKENNKLNIVIPRETVVVVEEELEE